MKETRQLMKRSQLIGRDRVEGGCQIERSLSAAFTRVELAATLAALAILSALAAPILATTRSDAERAGCMNNLRRIGGGVRLWASDHQERVSWRTPLSVGGTLPDGFNNKPGAAWYEFSFLSNELVSPKILLCPADPQALVAPTWDLFKSNTFRSSALSYCIGLEALPEFPRSVVAFDRNMKPDTYGAVGCTARVTDAGSIELSFPGTTVWWTNDVHGSVGHVLLNDGSVNLTDSTSFRKIAAEQSQDVQQSMHFLRAR
jgi:hypothetical protein